MARMWSLPSQVFFCLLLVVVTASPVPLPEPLTATAFGTFPVNVILTASAAQFGVWVPHDGVWYPTSDLDCLNAGADSYGACSTPAFDHVGVVAGNGPCSFIGANGAYVHLLGLAGEGFSSVAPPQQITWVTCGP